MAQCANCSAEIETVNGVDWEDDDYSAFCDLRFQPDDEWYVIEHTPKSAV